MKAAMIVRWLCVSAGLVLFAGCGSEETPATPATSTADAKAAALPADPVAGRVHVKLENAMAGWVPSGLTVSAGDEVAIFADGRLEALGLSFQPQFVIWYRVGEDGNAENLAANHDTFVAQSPGEIFVTIRPPGMYWSDRRGTYPEGFDTSPPVPVDFELDLIRFTGSAADGLSALAAQGDPVAATALASLATRKSLPRGFEPLWNIGASNVWADGAGEGRPGITADTSDDSSIVKLPLDIPLTQNTQISFDWRYDAVPALGPETEQQFHDYLSIAIEFDNGQDLTWLRAAHLEPGTQFHCPLAWWDTRETHYVLEGAQAPLGQWSSHKRSILADYTSAVGLEAPTRIVGVWFIANSLFGGQRAAASFANVEIVDGETRTRVF